MRWWRPFSTTVDIGLVIPEKGLRGKGIGTEATMLLAGEAFDQLHMHKVELWTRADNRAAQKVAEEMLSLRPQSADGLWLKGLALRAQEAADADQFLQQAADSPDARAGIWSRYGLELMARRDYAAARGYLDKSFRAGAKDDPTGFKTLKKVLGDPDMDAFKTKWEADVLKLTFP